MSILGRRRADDDGGHATTGKPRLLRPPRATTPPITAGLGTGGGSRPSRVVGMVAVLGVIAQLMVLTAQPAAAESFVTVRVVIERIEERGCTDTTDGSDFYGRITINGAVANFGEIADDDQISPNWTAEQLVDVDTTSSVPVRVEIADSDGFLNFGDDECDLTANAGDDLDLTVGLIPCTVTGDVSGACSTQLTTEGGGSDSVFVRFRVEVDEPSSAGGLTVRCTHAPLWPQPGDDVTITIESLDADVQVGDTVLDMSTPPGPPLVDRSRIADEVEIWVEDQSGPDLSETGRTMASFVVNDVAAGDLVYSCRAIDDGTAVFTGWRRTRVGAPDGAPIPVLFAGDRASRVDVVFVADTDSYTGPGDAGFQTDVGNLIRGAYFGQDYFLANQQSFNFWLADQVGDADRVPAPTAADPSATRCVLARPGNWNEEYGWADTGAIIHADAFRDCAGGGLFSTEPTSLGTALHETGHSPFGLADEYCCDGGYFENPPNPNLFDTSAECQTDAPALRRTGASDCRTITDTRSTPAKSWFLSEPTPNDLMNDDRRPPQAADVRRMDWFIENCRLGGC